MIWPGVVIGAVPPATGDGQYVDGTPLSAQKRSLSTVSKGCLSGLTGWLYMMKYGLSRSACSPPRTSQAIRHMGSTVSTPPAVMTSGLVVAAIMARNCLGYASPASMPSGPRARHDEVDLGQRVAEAGRLGHVLHLAEAALPGLQVDQVHDVGAVAVVGAVAAEVHGRLAGAVVDQEARRRRLARLLDEGGRHVDQAVGVLRAAAVEHDLLALLVEHDHADVGEDAEGRVVDAPLLLVGEEADATGADLLAAVCHGHS